MQTQSEGQTPATRGDYAACRCCGVSALCRPRANGTGASAPLARRRAVRRNSVLFRAGEPFRFLYAICTGSIKTCAHDSGGCARILGFHLAGEVLGMNAISSGAHACDAVTLEATHVCEIRFDDLETLGEHDPTVRRVIFHMMGDAISHDHALLLSFLGKQNAAERLATYLLTLSQRYAVRGFSGGQFKLSMSRNDIANYLGLAQATVSRLFTQLQRDGIIDVSAKRVHIHDHDQLARIAGTPSAVTRLWDAAH